MGGECPEANGTMAVYLLYPIIIYSTVRASTLMSHYANQVQKSKLDILQTYGHNYNKGMFSYEGWGSRKQTQVSSVVHHKKVKKTLNRIMWLYTSVRLYTYTSCVG